MNPNRAAYSGQLYVVALVIQQRYQIYVVKFILAIETWQLILDKNACSGYTLVFLEVAVFQNKSFI